MLQSVECAKNRGFPPPPASCSIHAPHIRIRVHTRIQFEQVRKGGRGKFVFPASSPTMRAWLRFMPHYSRHRCTWNRPATKQFSSKGVRGGERFINFKGSSRARFPSFYLRGSCRFFWRFFFFKFIRVLLMKHDKYDSPSGNERFNRKSYCINITIRGEGRVR